MRQVAILGNGQLGGMMKEAGMALGIAVTLLDIEGDTLPPPDHVVTAEREHWIPNDFTRALVKHHADIAAGGVGMTTVAYCAVSPDGRTFPDQVLLDDPLLARTPVVRNGPKATLGFQPDVWETWE